MAYQIVMLTADLLAAGASLTPGDIRNRFLVKTEPSNVFLFLRAQASIQKLLQTQAIHRDNEFVGRLALGHFFELSLVLERAIHARSGVDGLLAKQAARLSKLRGGKLSEKMTKTDSAGKSKLVARIIDLNDQAIADSNALLRALLDGTATFSDGQPVLQTDMALAVAYVPAKSRRTPKLRTICCLGETAGAATARSACPDRMH